MPETVTITVHCCEVCGDHAEEVVYDDAYCLDGMYLKPCEMCGILACWSCLSDGHCCDRRADIEMEGKPHRGQQELFT